VAFAFASSHAWLHEVLENRRRRGASQVRIVRAVRRERGRDCDGSAGEVRKSIPGGNHQRDAAEDLAEHVDRIVPLIDERLIRLLVRRLTRIVERLQLNPHIARRDGGSELRLRVIRVPVVGQIHLD